MISMKQVMANIEAQWKHVAYDPSTDKIYLLGYRYRCLDTKADWCDFQDGRKEKKPLVNNRRMRFEKVKKLIYLGEK